jgi:hypothetical protein
MNSLARLALRHPRKIISFWLVVLLLSLAAARIDCEPEAAYPPFCTRSLKREAPARLSRSTTSQKEMILRG